MLNKYFLAKMNIPAYLKKFLYNRYVYTEIDGIPPTISGTNVLTVDTTVQPSKVYIKVGGG